MFVERRSNRSRRPDLATRQYLLNVARRHRPRAVVLTDMAGEVIAGVEGKPFMEGGFIACRASERTSRAVARAAIADFRAQDGGGRTRWVDRMVDRVRGLRRRPAPTDHALPKGARVAQRFSAGDRDMLMVVVGEHGGAALSDALDGLRRIFDEPISDMSALVAEGTMIEGLETVVPGPDVEDLAPTEIGLRPAAATTH